MCAETTKATKKPPAPINLSKELTTAVLKARYIEGLPVKDILTTYKISATQWQSINSQYGKEYNANYGQRRLPTALTSEQLRAHWEETATAKKP